MPIIGTGLNVAGLRSEFFDRFREVTTVYMDLATRYSSNKDVEHHKWLGTVPQMREWGTGRLAKGLRTESYDVANAKYEATIEVDRDEIDDDQTGQIRLRIQELARRAATHKDKMIADLLNNGDQAGYLAYDGKVFFADDHESGASGAQDNLLTFAVADDDVDVFTATEGKTALQNAIEAMMLYLDDQGEPGDRDQGGLVIVCPWAQYYRWLEVINASVINNTTNVMTAPDHGREMVPAQDKRGDSTVHLPGSSSDRVRCGREGQRAGVPPGEVQLRSEWPISPGVW